MSSINQAAEIIKNGGCIIYPTETLYAIGASGYNSLAARRINKIKSRHYSKPLPLVIGHQNQLSMVTQWFSSELNKIMEIFWPGPLSVLVPAVESLAPETLDESGYCCVRCTPHSVAVKLCLRSGIPLIATSANKAGKDPAAEIEELDRQLIREVDLVVRDLPGPSGGSPSSIVKIVGSDRLQMIRSGAVSAQDLQKAGFEVD